MRSIVCEVCENERKEIKWSHLSRRDSGSHTALLSGNLSLHGLCPPSIAHTRQKSSKYRYILLSSAAAPAGNGNANHQLISKAYTHLPYLSLKLLTYCLAAACSGAPTTIRAGARAALWLYKEIRALYQAFVFYKALTKHLRIIKRYNWCRCIWSVKRML